MLFDSYALCLTSIRYWLLAWSSNQLGPWFLLYFNAIFGWRLYFLHGLAILEAHMQSAQFCPNI